MTEFIDAVAQAGAASKADEPKRKLRRARVDLKAEKLDETWLNRVLQDIGMESFSTPPAADLRPAEVSQAAAAAAAGS